MKKNNTTHNHIPDIDIIDLEHDGNKQIREDMLNIDTAEDTFEEAYEEELDDSSLEEYDGHNHKRGQKKGFRAFLNIHVLFLLIFIVCVTCIVIKFKNWGERIDITQITNDAPGEYLDVLDQFLPLVDSQGKIVDTDEVDTIVAFGNAPFADDRDSKDNLANLIADATGATVYNCSISGSYLASQWPHFDANEAPMDAYCFYWLVTLATTNGINTDYYSNAAKDLGDATPPEAQEVHDLLLSIDFSEVDVITIMYDASDYLMGHEMYDDLNPTNIQCFTGNLEAGIELLQATYPHIRIIVMSPTYAYAIDDNGDYVSSDIHTYGQDVLSTYVIKEYASCSSRSVSFVDHLYGTITETNAEDYLSDNLHLNVEGRKLVTQRFMDALTRNNRK